MNRALASRDLDEGIEAALRQLPIRADLADPEQEIAQWVLGLKLAAWAGAGNGLPRALPASRKVTVEELRRLGELCADLVSHIRGMHSPALRLFEREQGQAPHPLRLEDTLRDTILSTRKAWEVARREEQPASRRSKNKPGPAEVAWAAAIAFQSLTGKRPTTSTKAVVPTADCPATTLTGGPFVDLVQRLFDALGFEDASAVAQAQEAVARFKRK